MERIQAGKGMKQYGDITKLSGYELDPVDLIVGGSPCQDLSVAGNRAGLSGERSGLFMEMIRIIKEMREKTNGIYPRYTLWENVTGAFSSNQKRDFQAVLTEFVRITEPNVPDVPMPKKNWAKSGVLMGDGWSLAYRTHDAQYWGVPQRRKRISLVLDLRGQSAPEILFERKSLSGNPEQSGTAGQGSARTTADSIGTASGFSPRQKNGPQGNGINEDVSFTLNATDRYAVFDSQVYHGCKEFTDGISQTVNAQYGTGGNNQPLVVAIENGQLNQISMSDKVNALDTMHDHQAIMSYRGGQVAKGSGAVLPQANSTVRRLTPLECERLQNFPDNWTNIPGASDSKRYKALGNSIARPFWTWLAKRLTAMGGVKTIGSLFDGIGGFPLCFKEAGAETLWTSEIEPFCQKVVEWHVDNGDL